MKLHHRIHSHLKQPHKKYLGGLFAGFAVVKTFVLLAGTLGILQLGSTFAQEVVELNSGNIVTEYGCAIDATKCDLSNRGITSIAVDTFVNHTNLIDLHLYGNQISVLPEGIFDSLSALTTLHLYGNQISVLPEGIFDSLTGLTYLGLSDNQISELPTGIFDSLSGLQQLYLYNNQLTGIDLSGLSGLTYLNLGDNQLTGIDLSGLSRLQQLYLYNNQLSTIDLSGLSGLTSLNLRNNQLTEIDLSGITSLTWLELGNNQLTEINLSGLDNLIELYLYANQLTEIDFSGVTGLKRLNLGWNNFTGIDLSALTNLKWLQLNNNQLTEIDLSTLTGLQRLRLDHNELTEIFGLETLNSITRGDIRWNSLSSEYINNNQAFFNSHNISYYPQKISNDDEGDFSITGQLFNQRPIYSGTLLIIQGEVSYSGEIGAETSWFVGVPFGFSIETVPFMDSKLTGPTTVYGGPGDGCYADFVQGTGDYVPYINTLLDTAITQMLDCSEYPGELCTVTIPDMGSLPLTHSDEIYANSGMTTWSWILVDVFNMMGQQSGQEHFLQISTGVESMLLSSIAPSTILSNVCVGRGNYNLNQCPILGDFFGGDLGLDEVEGCGAEVYTMNGYIYNNKSDDGMLIGSYPYVAEGLDINLFVSSEDTYDTDLSNNMATLHIEMTTGAGVTCINSGNTMETIHGDIENIYTLDESVCSQAIGLCIEGDMYGISTEDGSFNPIIGNVYYQDDTCTTPILPTATNVQIIGNTTLGSSLLGSYDYIYDLIASWNQVGTLNGNMHYLTVDDGVPYVVYHDPAIGASTIQKFSDDSWNQVGTLTGKIDYLTVDDGVPYVRYHDPAIGASTIQKFSDDSWNQVGTLNGYIEYLTVDDGVPYVVYHDPAIGASTIQKFSDDSWNQVGTLTGKINYLTVDDGVPYVRYHDPAIGASTIQKFSDDSWNQVGTLNGYIEYLTVDDGVPYVIYHDPAIGASTIQKFSDDSWNQVGTLTGKIDYLTVDDGVPYVRYYDNNGISSILKFSDDSWNQVGTLNGNIDYLTVDNGVPYVKYTTDDGSASTIQKFSSLEQQEGQSTYQRWRNDTLITGATGESYTITSQDIGQTIYFEVTPKSTELVGLSVKSEGILIPTVVTPPTQTSPSGGGGGGSSITKDICPENRDCSDSYYDGLCGPCDLEEYQEQKKHGAPDIQFLIQNKELFNQAVEAVKASTKKSYSTELLQAYTFAKDLGITTIDNIDDANLEGNLIRSHMAKMISNFAIKTLQTPIDTGAQCEFADMKNQSEEMQLYAKLSCQLGLMGQNVETFKPNDVVTRAEFGTVLSRILRGDKNEGGNTYYAKHLQALNQSGIMKKIDTPLAQELRGRTMLMMMRSAK